MNFTLIAPKALCDRCGNIQPVGGKHCDSCGTSFVFGTPDACGSGSLRPDSGLEFIRHMMSSDKPQEIAPKLTLKPTRTL